jgi:hypothetical protein
LRHRRYAIGDHHARAVVSALLPERLQGDLMSRIAMSLGIASGISTQSKGA